MKPCKRTGCPDKTTRGYTFCSAVCNFLDRTVNKTLSKGDRASMAELSALLGVVDAVNTWRSVVALESGRRNASTSSEWHSA